MGGDRKFWIFFGGIFLAGGLFFLFGVAGAEFFTEPQQRDAPLWPFVLAGVLTGGLGGCVLTLAWRDRAREQRLMQHGTLLPATILDLHRSRIEINRQSRWYVRYRYEYDGRKLMGESHAMPGDWVADFKPGDAVRIRVDPRKPEDTLFIGPA